MKLDFHKVTHGLARGSSAANTASRNIGEQHGLEFVSDDQRKCGLVNGDGHQQRVEQRIARRRDGRRRSPTPEAASATANGNGNGANGNGNGANGNGNGGVGNGNGNGNLKH